MARSLLVLVALVAFAGLVAAEFDNTPAPVDHDASDLLYKGVSEQPASALPQRSLMGHVPVLPVYPRAKVACFTGESSPKWAKYWVDIKIKKYASYNKVFREFRNYYLYGWPMTFRRPDITNWKNMRFPLVPGKKNTYRIVVRSYYEHELNKPRTITGAACPISLAEVRYARHIAKRAGEKLDDYYDYSSEAVQDVHITQLA